METVPSQSRALGPLVLSGGLLLLTGCDTGNLARTFGLTRDSPDEYTVTTRAPLSMPPEYNLRPPEPGASRPQEQTERQQAEQALAPALALGAQPAGSVSPGQTALIQETGPAASSDVRRRVDQEAHSDADPGFVDKLLYWRKPDPQNAQVDAQKESQRLRQNAALGESPSVGETPIIQPTKKGWFSGLFSWL
jgi:hypothetical protein